MVNTDKGQEGIANIIEARNKNKILLACKEKTAFITKVARIFEYNLKCVIMQLGRSEEESGDYAWTLTLTDDYTLWTVNRAVWNKGRYGVCKAFEHIFKETLFAK